MEQKLIMALVDERDEHRDAIRKVFEEKFQIVVCKDRDELQQLYMVAQPLDVIIVNMDATGYDSKIILQRFATMHEYQRTVLIASIGSYSAQKENEAFALGAEEVIAEPLNLEGLQSRVNRLVKRCILLRREVDNTIATLMSTVQTDDLTGLGNRAEFNRQVRSFILKNHQKGCVIGIWNIDRFKVINELYGSVKGDMVLAALGRKLRGLIGVNGHYGRYEADKFVFCTTRKYLNQIMEQMEEVLVGGGNWNPLDYKVQLHMGIYTVDEPTMQVEVMCDRADMALQVVKGNYVNRYAYYSDELRTAILSEQELVSEMDVALAERQFVVNLQPIVSTATGRTVSAEALIRWVHPTKGVISPGLFIPIFEKNGFIAQLDLFVCEQVCMYQRERIDACEPVLPISINVSRVNFYKPEFVQEILSITEKYKVRPDLIKIEITEGAYEDKPLEMIEAIQEYQSRSFKVMMDDFGSGYSSLNTLKDFNVDVLKIDMKFINDLETSERANNILFSIFQMAKALKMETVAEGVETRAQFELLAGMGCDSIQGYLFSKPITMEEFRERLIAEEHRVFEEGAPDNRRTILVVDDHMVEREVIKKMIGDRYIVVEAENGKEALELLKRKFDTISLVIADIRMPEMGGLELLSHMSNIIYLKEIPVIMVTAFGERENEEEALTRGALEIITKPFDARLVQKRIENILKISETEAKVKQLQMLWERADKRF
ncbi:diguanylate cyclase (GGDEF) domain-containing protein [Lachnospiraceae bacterium XBB1006]|nr:diguanylate cyclase (GGDEF) domain-containing protein [Lachnospiraceae bacterium XBB1006]